MKGGSNENFRVFRVDRGILPDLAIQQSKRVFFLSLPVLDSTVRRSPNNSRPTLRNVDCHSVAHGKGEGREREKKKVKLLGQKLQVRRGKQVAQLLRSLRRIFFFFPFPFLRMKHACEAGRESFLIQACTSWPSFDCCVNILEYFI